MGENDEKEEQEVTPFIHTSTHEAASVTCTRVKNIFQKCTFNLCQHPKAKKLSAISREREQTTSVRTWEM